MRRAPPTLHDTPTFRADQEQRTLLWRVWLVVLACLSIVARPHTRPAIEYNDRAPLDSDPGSSNGHARSRRAVRWHWMIADWRWVWTEVGTALMVVGVADSAWGMLSESYVRAVHMHHVLNVSKGFAIMMISFIILAQLATGVALMVPTIYHTTGTIAPSAILAVTLWFEILVFGDWTDGATLGRCLCFTATAVMLALFRFDRQARNRMQQLPTSGTLLNIEFSVKTLCTKVRAGTVLPPAAVALLGWAATQNPYWRAHGVVYEWYRGRFQAAWAAAALMFLISGQDTRAHVLVGDKLERLHDWMLSRKEDLLGQERGWRVLRGKKKAL